MVNKRFKLKLVLISAFLIAAIGAACNQIGQPGYNANGGNAGNGGNSGNTGKTTDLAAAAPCNASADWVSNPQGPNEVQFGKDAQICQFHQFSWQWFLAMMNQAGKGRAYEDQQNYPMLLAGSANSCAGSNIERRVFVRAGKNSEISDKDMILPERIGQAGGGDTIYDQNGNVVFYEVRFSRNQCSLDPATAKMFPSGTTEIKVSYRVITEADKPDYVWINADINADGKIEANELLGMVGFHFVRSTELHPEFIWATFEHKSNAPECQKAADGAAKAASFTSAQCAGELPNSVDPAKCNFNMAKPGTLLKGGPPTEICRVYHAGSKPGDNQYDTNVSNIDSLNKQLVGPDGFITKLQPTDPLAVLKNYELIGALWENDVTQPSSNLANQRGSIQLANSTMETTFQQAVNFKSVPYTGTSNLQPAANCFACHGYTPGNNITQSHIFPGIFGKKS